jgi:hypothetical protein
MGPSLAAAITLLLAAALAGPANRAGALPSDPYRTALSRVCPTKHLERLAPADLLEDLEAFPRSLPPRLRDRLEKSSRAGESRCADVGGASCVDRERLRAIERLHLTRRFAARVCTVHLGCRTTSDCD